MCVEVVSLLVRDTLYCLLETSLETTDGSCVKCTHFFVVLNYTWLYGKTYFFLNEKK